MAQSPIEEARAFVRMHVQDAALRSELPREIKNKVRNSEIWLSKFKRVGDLLNYLRRFKASDNDAVYYALKQHGLRTFEDIVPEFEKRFSAWAHDRTRPSDFVVGAEYAPQDILIFSNTYDTRAGGMFVLEGDDAPAAVVIKATLRDGPYPNEWIEYGKTLKYYLKSIKGDFGEHFKTNAAVINKPNVPIITFVRETGNTPFVFSGIFHFREIVRNDDGSKYFILARSTDNPLGIVESEGHARARLQEAVRSAQLDSRQNRLDRIARAPKRPQAHQVLSTVFDRNSDVVAEVLYRAQGKCERCALPAPFRRKTDGSPYLEVHHKLPLAQGGDDTVENAVALCPNCHRKSHFG